MRKSVTKSADAVQDLIGALGPDEGSGILVTVFDIAKDGAFDPAGAAVGAYGQPESCNRVSREPAVQAIGCVLGLILLLSVMACGQEPRTSSIVHVDDLFSDTAQIRAIGLADDTSTLLIFAEIVDGQFTPSGQQVVVLTAYPPFVRVFDLKGKLQAAFTESGDGPGEARQPHGIALTDSTLLLIDSGRLSLFSLSGTYLASVAPADFLPLGVAAGCNGDWVILGPATGIQAEETTPWLRSLVLDTKGYARGQTLLSFGDPSPPVAIRRVRQLSKLGQRVVFYQEHDLDEGVVEFSCPSYARRYQREDMSTGGDDRRDRRIRTSQDGQAQGFTLPANVPLFTGISATNDGFIVTRSVQRGLSRYETLFTVQTASGRYEATVAGQYAILDVSDAGLLLFRASSPVAHVRLVSSDMLLDAMSVRSVE